MCSKCANFLDYSNFCIKYYDGKNYLQSSCKNCNRKKLKNFRKLNVEKRLYWSAKHRATRMDIPFDLSFEDITIPEKCPILGIEINKNPSLKRDDHSPSIDKIDNSKGYTKDNFVVCSWRANKIKTNSSFEEIEKLYNFLKNRKEIQ